MRRIIDDPRCFRCNDPDTIAHYFHTRPAVSEFWKAVFHFSNTNYHAALHPTANNILFGFLIAPSIVNLLIILAKHYIHVRANQQYPLIFHMYLAYVSDTYRSERQAAARCANRYMTFCDKWKLFSLLVMWILLRLHDRRRMHVWGPVL